MKKNVNQVERLGARSVICVFSSASLFFLCFQPNRKESIALAFIWLMLTAISIQNAWEPISWKNLACLFALLPAIACFIDSWSYSSLIKAIASLAHLPVYAFLACIALILAFVASFLLTSVFSVTTGKLEMSCPNSKVEIPELLTIAIIAIVSLALLSKSSFLYPFNDSVDVNCFLSVSKSMMKGQVLYRDVYDQKGPMLFFFYLIPAAISGNSFFGVYILEVIANFFFLLFSYKTAVMLTDRECIWLMPIYAFIYLSTRSFGTGGGAEEMCLPSLCCSVFLLTRSILLHQGLLNRREAFCVGIFLGIALWVKFTFVGFYIGFAIAVLINYICKRQIRELFRMMACAFLGLIIISAPVILYFLWNKAMPDLMEGYFYYNIFGYHVAKSPIWYAEWQGIRYSYTTNTVCGMILLLGIGSLVSYGKKLFWEVFLCLGGLCFFTFTRGNFYFYYPYAMVCFLPFALAAFWAFTRLAERKLENFKAVNGLRVLTIIIICTTLFMASSNTKQFLMKKEELPQFRFAEIINRSEDKTLLNYNMLDFGVYTTTDTAPTVRFFMRHNLDTSEIDNIQDGYIHNKEVNFIISREIIDAEGYELVAQEQYDTGEANNQYYLYQRNAD